MNKEPKRTPEEGALCRFVDENYKTLSEAARTIIDEADSASHANWMVRLYGYQEGDHEYHMKNMHLAATELSEREHKILVQIWRAALVAAASLDPEDYETVVGYRVFRGDLHYCYRMFASMIEEVLNERTWGMLEAELRRSAERTTKEDSPLGELDLG